MIRNVEQVEAAVPICGNILNAEVLTICDEVYWYSSDGKSKGVTRWRIEEGKALARNRRMHIK